MGRDTIIAWTNHTFNIAWGCVKVSPGCQNCYAEQLAQNSPRGYRRDGEIVKIWGTPASGATRRVMGENHWRNPILWHREALADQTVRLVFSSSMCDVFEDHPIIDQQRERLWQVIRATPWLHWQLLTKRPDNVQKNLPYDWNDGWPNVWLGTSIESADYAYRADVLKKISAVVRFVSYEPALGPLAHALDLDGIDWVIYGGESGRGYRDHDLSWPRDMKAACEKTGTAFFYKQAAAIRTEMGIELDGELVRKFPTPRETRPNAPKFDPESFTGPLAPASA